MDRGTLRRAVGSSLIVGLLVVCGCAGPLVTAAYLLKGRNFPAEYDGLKGKTVAVVCRSQAQLQYSAGAAANLISQEVSRDLDKNIRSLELVDPQRVAAWIDERGWDDFTEVELGDAVKAEMVVSVELEDFSLYEGQTLYKGKSQLRVRVFDVTEKKVVFEKSSLPVVHPPTTARPVSDKPENDFRREFVAVIGNRVGRMFYPYDMYADVAYDSRVLDP